MENTLVKIMDQPGIEKIIPAKDGFKLNLIWTDYLENGRQVQQTQEQAERESLIEPSYWWKQ